MGVPENVRRALNNILPTKDNLSKKQVIGNVFRPICKQEEESVVHVLWSCPASGDVWGEATSPVQKWMSSFGSLTNCGQICIQN